MPSDNSLQYSIKELYRTIEKDLSGGNTNRTDELRDSVQSIGKRAESSGRDDLPLEEALSLYERGSALAAHCSKQLEEAELRVRQWQANSAEAFDSWQEQ